MEVTMDTPISIDQDWLPKKLSVPEVDLLAPGLHDTGNAERVQRLFGSGMRYCSQWKKWLLYDGKRWAIDTTQRARQLVKLTMVEFLRQAIKANLEVSEGFAKKSLNGKELKYALSLAEPELAITPDQLDQNIWLLNFGDGTLDIESGELRPHRREDFITKLVPSDFDPRAQCPNFRALVRSMMQDDPEMKSYLQIVFGYCLTGTTREKVIFVFFGPTGTGKTTLLTAVREALGDDYAALIQIQSLMSGRENNAINSDLSDLFGVRFAMTSEPEEGQKLSPSKLKRITQGTGKIKTRRLYENCFSFAETHHLFLDTNVRPAVPGADGATFARLHAIPCLVQVSPNQMDRELASKLRKEASGIVAWAARGARRYLASGLPKPAKVNVATDSWREQCDFLDQFLSAKCVLGEYCRGKAGELYSAYRAWAGETGEQPLTMTAFGLRITERFAKEHTERGTVYFGVGLQTTAKEPEAKGKGGADES
jgi:putative DNA primase/helicase